MNYKPLVSIVIPVYKGERYVAEAIDSALNQTYKNIEVLVINDGSPDSYKIRDAVSPFLNEIQYIEKKNGGVSSVLNLAFEQMRGEWLSWLSHDDTYYPDKIEKQIQYINENDIEVNGRGVIFSDFDFIDEFGREIKIPTKNQITPKMDSEELILSNIKRNSFGGCTFLIPRHAYHDIGGFSEELRTISDFDYWYRLLFAGYKFHYIPEKLMSNRMHGEQVTYTLSELGEKESQVFHEYVVEQLVSNSEYCKVDNLVRIAYYMDLRGIKNVPDLAYSHAIRLSEDRLLKIKIKLIRVKASLLNKMTKLAKNLYVKYFITKKFDI